MNGHEQRQHKTALLDLEAQTADAFEALTLRVRREMEAMGVRIAKEQKALRTQLEDSDAEIRQIADERYNWNAAILARAMGDHIQETEPLRRTLWGRLKWLLLGPLPRLHAPSVPYPLYPLRASSTAITASDASAKGSDSPESSGQQ